MEGETFEGEVEEGWGDEGGVEDEDEGCELEGNDIGKGDGGLVGTDDGGLVGSGDGALDGTSVWESDIAIVCFFGRYWLGVRIYGCLTTMGSVIVDYSNVTLHLRAIP